MIEDVTLLTLLVYAVVGLVLGLLLGGMLKGGGFGWFGNICLGLLGAFVGGLVATFANPGFANLFNNNDLVMNLAAAAGGCVLLTLIVAIFKRR